MPTTKTAAEYVTIAEARETLELGERRIRDYVAAGIIKKTKEGLNARDVAEVLKQRMGKKGGTQLRALSVLPSALPAEQREALMKAGNALGPQRSPKAPAILPAAASDLPDCAWLTLEQAERYIGLPEAYLQDMIDAGQLKALPVGVRRGVRGQHRIHRRDLDAITGELQAIARPAVAGS